jgi:hypothetical protein
MLLSNSSTPKPWAKVPKDPAVDGLTSRAYDTFLMIRYASVRSLIFISRLFQFQKFSLTGKIHLPKISTFHFDFPAKV